MSQERKRIDLALQGGGSHGALTWGVLDRLLEDERLEIVGISGTSAGAMNAWYSPTVSTATVVTEPARPCAPSGKPSARRLASRPSSAASGTG